MAKTLCRHFTSYENKQVKPETTRTRAYIRAPLLKIPKDNMLVDTKSPTNYVKLDQAGYVPYGPVK